MSKEIQYTFIEQFYTTNKKTYEPILCECLNKSKTMTTLKGGNFELIKEQSDSQPDVVSLNSGYTIDFKLMIAESLKEFQNITAPVIYEIAPGCNIIGAQKSLTKKVLLLWNCCRNMNETRLTELRQRRDEEAKSVIHFFDKLLLTPKNILIFFPIYFSTVDKTLDVQTQFQSILDELSTTTEYFYQHRQKYCPKFDTFICYLVKISDNREPYFIIAQFTNNGLNYIDTIPMFSLESISNLLADNAFY